jgi:Domain of unknown function (DUF6458)
VGISVSIVLIAIGAILAFAVNATVSGLEIDTVGWILMIVGAIGPITSMIFWGSWGGFRSTSSRTTRVERSDYR